QTPATWHWSRAAQTTGFVPTQRPAVQESVCVQALPSLQAVPSAAVGVEQKPVAGSHKPATWHWSCAVPTVGVPPTQAPAWQASVWVQALWSSHFVPSAAAGFEQTPVSGLQTPTVWHWSCAPHTVASPPTQAPAWQASVWVQALWSSHLVPSATA